MGFRGGDYSKDLRLLTLGKSYTTKQVEVVAAHEGADWIVITAIARYF